MHLSECCNDAMDNSETTCLMCGEHANFYAACNTCRGQLIDVEQEDDDYDGRCRDCRIEAQYPRPRPRPSTHAVARQFTTTPIYVSPFMTIGSIQ